jgi:hypothetical protein
MPLAERRTLLIAAACVCAGALVYELLPKDERAIGALLGELCSELNRTRDVASLARLRAALGQALLPSSEVHLVELDLRLEGAPAVLEHAQDLLSGPPLSFTLSSVQTRISGNHAQVVADLVAVISGSGEQHRDLRPTRIELAKRGNDWRIEQVVVEGVAHDEPEPRP